MKTCIGVFLSLVLVGCATDTPEETRICAVWTRVPERTVDCVGGLGTPRVCIEQEVFKPQCLRYE